MKKSQIIDNIMPGSIAEELGLEAGDEIISINDTAVEDVLDYRFLCQDEYLSILVRRGDEEGVFEVEKDLEDDLGIEFSDGLMDEYHSCTNKCIFCFIDQMPPNMRPTLYFKDDDDRLSFLQGNYITLTNLKENEVERIIKYHLSPINISIHTMNPELRCQMLHNRFAGSSLKILDRFFEAGISMNGQIVLCEGINDGKELEYTIEALSKYLPNFESLSIVPVGLTKYRQGLEDLKPVSIENANRVIDTVEAWQKKLYPEYGLHFVHASDEFYLLTGRNLPPAETYDGYLQLENGVGMIRSLEEDVNYALSELSFDDSRTAHYTIATGKLACKPLRESIAKFNRLFPNIKVDVIPITNYFFGEEITVAGLITGQDLVNGIKEYKEHNKLGDKLLISVNMLRSGESVFLDDMTIVEVSKEINCPVISVGQDGFDFVNALLGNFEETFCHQPYEVKD